MQIVVHGFEVFIRETKHIMTGLKGNHRLFIWLVVQIKYWHSIMHCKAEKSMLEKSYFSSWNKAQKIQKVLTEREKATKFEFLISFSIFKQFIFIFSWKILHETDYQAQFVSWFIKHLEMVFKVWKKFEAFSLGAEFHKNHLLKFNLFQQGLSNMILSTSFPAGFQSQRNF